MFGINRGNGGEPINQAKRRYARLVSRRSFLGGGLAAIGATAAIAIPAGCQGQLYRGTAVLQFDLGGKSMAAADHELRQQLARFEQEAVTFRQADGPKTWTASLGDLGYRIDYAATLAAAFQHGRDSGLSGRYLTWFDGGNHRQVFPLVFVRNDETLPSYLSAIDAEVAEPAVDAKLVQTGSEIEVQPDVSGQKLDIASVRTAVDASVHEAHGGTVVLTMAPVLAGITTDSLSQVRQAAASLLEGPVMIVAGDTSWAIEPDTLAAALVIPETSSKVAPSLDPTKLTDVVTETADSLAVRPINAVVGWDNGPYAIKKGEYGRRVEPAALAIAVAEAATREDRVAQVPVIDIAPDVRSDNLSTLGLTELIATGDSSFAGSSEDRIVNVQVAAQHISATLIPPGTQFSFNDSLGPISVDNGYVDGKIIKGDWYASDLGGGVCQVSTTVYRAALRAGMVFDEWHPHSFRVSFYELDGWPMGIDAAIYQPNTPDEWELDLKFTNTSDTWMLLQMVEDRGHVAAQLYGTSLGYDVELSTPEVSEPIAPPEPQERKTDALPAGQTQALQTSAPGYNVSLTRTFSKDGKVVDQDTFVSHYQPQPEIWSIGTGSHS
ncbi:MAG: VanW family protein [Thermomicrobiales bacterium]